MERVRIAAIFADSERYGGESVTVCGWAKTIRDMKTFGFIELNDGSCFRNLQVVMDANSLSNYKEIAAQNVGAALIVRGTVVLTPEAKQPLEVKATEIEIEGASSPDYPLQKKRHSVEYLRTIQHLRPRTNLFSAAFRVRSAAAYAVHEFFQSRGFVYVNTPIITGSDCEGAGEMFQVTTLDLENPPRTPDGKVDYSKDFFGKKTSLTVSGQLNAENFAMAFGDVYTFGPTFRAENSNTARHAAEFWMIEPEMAFCDLDGDLEVMEAMVKYIITAVSEFNIPVLLTFLVGAVAGIVAFSHLLSWLLKNYHGMTVALLTGFMVGSLNKIWPWKITDTELVNGIAFDVEKNVLPNTFEQVNGSDPLVWQAILMCIIGILLIWGIEKLAVVLKK